MPEWIFLFLYLGNIHAMALKLTETECREMLQVAPANSPVCINIKQPMLRFYKEIKT